MKKNIRCISFLGIMALVIVPVILLSGGCAVGGDQPPPGGSVKLRTQYKVLSVADAKALVKQYGFFDKRWNKFGGFGNQYTLKTIGDQKIVTDRSTNLTWHQSGSQEPITYEEAIKWLEALNKKKYAGYSDWRLPTLAEAASLLERKAVEKYHIDPVFSRTQYSMISGDPFTNRVRVWGVSFFYGAIFKVGIMEQDFVRPVRSGLVD